MNQDYDDDSGIVSDDQFQHLRFNLLHTCSWINNSMRQFLEPHGITPKQYNILRLLHDRSPESFSIQEIRDMLADKMSDASRLVERLERKNLIDKFPSDQDRRSNRARITQEGSRLITEIRGSKSLLDNLIGDRLSDGEVETLNALLDRLK